MFKVKVCATSANLCVGFDVLGLALDLTNEFTFEIKDKFYFKGFLDKYSNCENNLVYYSYKKVFEILNKEIIPVEISFKGDIPVSRGLGSSSSLIVAGVFAANKVLNNPLSKDELFNICANIEGHPDNVAPAIYGGLVASYKDNDKYYPNIYDVSNKLKFIVAIPPYELSTSSARSALPKSLPYSDIVNNLSRIINIPKAFLDGDIELIKRLFNDKLHEPYRGKLIKEYNEIKKIANDSNSAFCISGSGSTMLIISYDDNIINKLKDFKLDIKILNVGKEVLVEEV